MDFSEEESEKTQILIHLDLPMLLTSLSIPQKASFSPNLQNTFQTFQQTQQIPLIESPDSLQTPESILGITKLLNTQNFQDIELIGKGGFGLVFKARNSIRNEIVALKLQVTFKEEEAGGQEEANLGKFLSKKVAENLKSKTLSIYSKISIKDPQGKFVLTIIEMELAKYSLRDLINIRRSEKKPFTTKELKKICFDLLENLYYIHLNNIAHFDIKPENVLFINMNESYILADFGISEEIPQNLSSDGLFLTPMKGSVLYMSPKMRDSWWSMKPIVTHDPFKSDIYSLGLIFFELNTVASLTEEEFSNLIKTRDEAYNKLLARNPMYLTFNYLFHEEECYKIPNILNLMLAEKEEDRKDIVEICLVCDLIEPILSGISTPLSHRFLPNINNPPMNFMDILGYLISKEYEKECIMISYISRPVVYIGQYRSYYENNNKYFQKEGKGILMKFEGGPMISELNKNNYKEILIYEGFWKDDIPHKTGLLQFNYRGTSYEGGFNQGRFHGKGTLMIRGLKTKASNWSYNLSEEFRYSLCLDFVNNLEPGYYKFYSEENKVFIKKKIGLLENKDFFFDLMGLGIETKLVVFLIELMGNRLKFFRAKFKEKLDSPFFNQSFDLIKFEGKDSLFENISRKLAIFLRPAVVKYSKTTNQNNIKSFISAVDILKSLVMQNVKTLSFIEIPYPDDFFLEVLNSKNLGNSLQYLRISHNEKISDYVFQDSLFLAMIVSLDLSQTKITDDALRIISNKSGVKVIESLNLAACRNISSEGIKFLMQSIGFKALKELNLDSCLITDEALEHFAKSLYVKNLRSLNLCHLSKIMDNSIRSLAISENSKTIQDLDLSYLHITDTGVGYLLNSKSLINLQKLNLTKCSKISNEALMKISQNFKNLKTFKLGRTKSNAKLAPKLSQIKTLSILKLKKCEKVTDEFLEQFTTSAVKTLEIKRLSLGYTKISDKSLQETLINPLYNGLETLKIPGCANIKDNGLIGLILSGTMRNLIVIDVSDTMIGDEFLISLGKQDLLGLISIKMNNCKRITDKGLQSLFTMKCLYKSLKWAYFRNCESFDSFLELVFFEKLELLDLKGCKILGLQKFEVFQDVFDKKQKNEKDFKLDLRNIEFPKEIIIKLRKMKPLVLTILIGCMKTFISKSTSILSLTHPSSESVEKLIDKSLELTDEVLKSFSNSQCLKNLLELNLSHCSKITDQGFCLIMNSPNCRNLEKIDLSFTNLTDFSLNSLFSGPSANCLQSLILLNNENISYNGLLDCFKTKKLIKLMKFDARIKQKPINYGIIEEFMKSLSFCETLTQISLDFNYFNKFPENPYDFQGVFQGLKDWREIREFDVNFANCRLNEDQICEFMAICENFKDLELMKCEFSGSVIKTKGCESIGKCLKGLKKLKKAEIGLKNEIISNITRRKLKVKMEGIVKNIEKNYENIEIYVRI